MIDRVAPAFLVLIGATGAFAHDEVEIGRRTNGQLVVHYHGHGAIALEASIFPGFLGHATGLIGFHSVELHDPHGDLHELSPQSDIRAQLVAIDPGLLVRDGIHVMGVGDSMVFGSPFFDYHPVFHIPDGHRGDVFTATFRFVDANHIHMPSELFSMEFTIDAGCIADFNQDGGVDGEDVHAFFQEWEDGHAHADVNGDGGIDGVDVAEFFDEWEHGHCD